MIPDNISKEHILLAIKEIDKHGYPITREPTYYYIKYNENIYPSKYVISIANKYANGQELTKFAGGKETNGFLESKGFDIVSVNDSNFHLFENKNINKNLQKGKFDLEFLIIEYDKNRDFLRKRSITEEESMKIRSQFLEDFRPDKILAIEIDKYILGKKIKETNEVNRNTFCYGLEFGLPGFGRIGAGMALKFGIYFDSKNKRYVYNANRFPSYQEAYKEILNQINNLLKSGKQFTKDKDWKKLSDTFEGLDELSSSVKSKILSVYFPESIVSINSQNGVKQILKSLFHYEDVKLNEEFLLNKEILWAIKENHPIMKNWSNFDYSSFIWYAWKNYDSNKNLLFNQEENSSNVNQHKIGYWVVRAGGHGKEEKDSLENDVITIAWNELSDLSSFKDKDNLESYYKKIYPNEHNGQVAQRVGQIWSFLSKIKQGDIVVLPLMSKKTKIVAIGRIVGDYEFKEITPHIKHLRKVKWLHKEIPISDFNELARKSLYSSRTVYQVTLQESLESIKEVMKKYNILATEIEDNNLVNETVDSSIRPNNSFLIIEKLSQNLSISIEFLKEIEELLIDKKQIIFYGPPGTSKTFVAKAFAEYFAKDNENIEIIQFHPSYSYEDFIEGIKPKLSAEEEATGFVKQPGLFKNLVDKCIENQDKKFVLIIDEINRGNISKIFGELIYLLEYRNEKIRLTYSPNEEFFIPNNLFIIGTMNSADRSIAFVDYALRRRFYFIEFYPDTQNQVILENWFLNNKIEQSYSDDILKMIKEINIEISKKLGREYQIGYSYFMVKNLDYEKIKRIIRYAIIPLLEQYFFGRQEHVDGLKKICYSYLNNLNRNSEADLEKQFLVDSSIESIPSLHSVKEDKNQEL